MGDFDPLTSKIADVYGPDGQRIGSIRSSEIPGGTMMAMGCGALIALAMAIWWGITWFFGSTANLITEGEFTTDQMAAQIHQHIDNPHYFTELATAAQISSAAPAVEVKDDRFGEQVAELTYTLTNGSSTRHTVKYALRNLRVEMRAGTEQKRKKGQRRGDLVYSPVLVPANCGTTGDTVEVPAGGTATVQTSMCTSHFRSKRLEDAKGEAFDSLPIGPVTKVLGDLAIVEIDGLPVAGGPANTAFCTPERCYQPGQK